MPDTPSPGLLLPVTVTCECRWQGLEFDRAGAFQLWAQHADRQGHDLATTQCTIET